MGNKQAVRPGGQDIVRGGPFHPRYAHQQYPLVPVNVTQPQYGMTQMPSQPLDGGFNPAGLNMMWQPPVQQPQCQQQFQPQLQPQFQPQLQPQLQPQFQPQSLYYPTGMSSGQQFYPQCDSSNLMNQCPSGYSASAASPPAYYPPMNMPQHMPPLNMPPMMNMPSMNMAQPAMTQPLMLPPTMTLPSMQPRFKVYNYGSVPRIN